MSFLNCLPLAFTEESIQRGAPSSSGVYGLSNSSNWIYVGAADDIKASLLAHLRAPSRGQFADKPAGFSFELSPPPDRIKRQQYLIVELSPSCQWQASQGRERR